MQREKSITNGMVVVCHLSQSDISCGHNSDHSEMLLVVLPWEPSQSGRKELLTLHTCTAACLSHQQQLGTITTPQTMLSGHQKAPTGMKTRSSGEQFLDAPAGSFVVSHKQRRWEKKGVGEGRHGWMFSYLTVTSSVNLRTRCVRTLRGSVLPPSCLGGGLLFRHAGRVELHAKDTRARRGKARQD